jgi:hypothetical protein
VIARRFAATVALVNLSLTERILTAIVPKEDSGAFGAGVFHALIDTTARN